jgi:hypothetical protein
MSAKAGAFAYACEAPRLLILAQIPKFGIVLVLVIVLGAWDCVTAKRPPSCN